MGFRRKNKNKIYGNLSKTEKAFVDQHSMDELKTLKTKTEEELEAVVSECTANVMRAKKEMESNPNYKSAMEIIAPFREGFTAAKKFQLSKANMALSLLHKAGRVDIGETEDDEI